MFALYVCVLSMVLLPALWYVIKHGKGVEVDFAMAHEKRGTRLFGESPLVGKSGESVSEEQFSRPAATPTHWSPDGKAGGGALTA